MSITVEWNAASILISTFSNFHYGSIPERMGEMSKWA